MTRLDTEHAQPYTAVQEAALIVLRLVVAAVFLYAGTAKWPIWSAPMEGMSALMHNTSCGCSPSSNRWAP